MALLVAVFTFSIAACSPRAAEPDAHEPEPTPSEVRDLRFEGTPVHSEEQRRICDSAWVALFKELEVAPPSRFIPDAEGCELDDWQPGDLYVELKVEFFPLEMDTTAELLKRYGAGASECLIYPFDETSATRHSVHLIRTPRGDFCAESDLGLVTILEAGRFTLRATRVKVSVEAQLWDSADATPVTPEYAILLRDVLVNAVRTEMVEE